METDLRRLARRLIKDWPDDYSTDRDLAELVALTAVSQELEIMIDQRIIRARRRERHGETPVPWAQIGAALGISGQAAGKRARSHHLPVEPMTPERYAQLVEEGRRVLGH